MALSLLVSLFAYRHYNAFSTKVGALLKRDRFSVYTEASGLSSLKQDQVNVYMISPLPLR